jgi:hypothetical protein
MIPTLIVISLSQLAIQSPFSPNQEAHQALYKSNSYIYIYIYIYTRVMSYLPFIFECDITFKITITLKFNNGSFEPATIIFF